MIPLLVTLLAAAGAASASQLTYTYNISGTVSGSPVSASAVLTLDTSAHTLDILLNNLQANPVSDVQLVSDFFITGLTGAPALDSSSASQGTPPGSTVSPRPGGTGWGFGGGSGSYELCIICPATIHPPGKTAPPSLLLIGPPDANGQYSNANASIYNHSPYLFEQAAFHLSGVTNAPPDTATVPFSGLWLGFGSEAARLDGGTPQINQGTATSEVPEPGGWILAGGGLMILLWGRRQLERTRRVRALAGRKE